MVGVLVLFDDVMNCSQCDHYQDVASNEMGDISPYDLYEDVCVASSDRQVSRLARLAHHADRRSAMGVLHRLHEKKQRNMRLHDQVGSGDIPSPPCIDNWLVGQFACSTMLSLSCNYVFESTFDNIRSVLQITSIARMCR